MSAAESTSPGVSPIRRQIALPIGKAVEIAWKSIRLRLARSLVVVSGIVLALAFLMSVWTGQAVTGAMRDWARQHRGDPSPQVRQEAMRLEALMQGKGVPMTTGDMAAERVQTRWVLGLALLVALVGILNAMLMSVTERFREIGTMKCLGALDGFIVKLFLIESLFQGVAGTVLGVVIGLGLGVLGRWWTFGAYLWRSFPVASVITSAAICLVTGVGLTALGAVYPAWQAARMEPIEAMRVET